MVAPTSTRGFGSNMRTLCTKKSYLRICVLTGLLFLLCSTCSGLVARRKKSAVRPSLKRGRRQHQAEHHRPLTEAQKADQNLQFMLSLYRSAAGPDGRPKQHRKFGSNTVRLIRPSTSSVHYLPASRDHHYTFTVQYNLDTLASEQLVRASFIHLRSSPTSTSNSHQTDMIPRCKAQITSLGKDNLVTMEPHERWTETDITAHVHGHVLMGNGRNRHLTLTAQYLCTEPDEAVEGSTLSWWWNHLMRKRKWRGEPHLEVPSLLLYVEEEREVNDWMAELLRAEGDDIIRQIGQWHPSVRRRRQSKDVSLDSLKKSTSSFSSIFTSQSAAINSDSSSNKRKSSPPKNLCRLHSFTLSFSELGLGNYFIAPPGYNPRFCQGDCPSVLHSGYHSPNHAIIQTYINELGLGDVPPPSCVPYKYMPMSVLVMDKRKVEYKEMDDMMAESCTCR
ncbi:bone morphogenetic protein 15 [Synchiropus picturatus]